MDFNNVKKNDDTGCQIIWKVDQTAVHPKEYITILHGIPAQAQTANDQ